MTHPSPEIDASQRTAARVVGLTYPLSFAFVVYANFAMRGRLLVSKDMAESIRRVAAAQSTFRFSIAFDIMYGIGAVVLAVALYVILGRVNRPGALVASGLKLIYAMTTVLMVLSYESVARLVSDPWYAQHLTPEALQSMVRFSWFSASSQYYVGLAFWSLSATLFCWIWLQSRYIPRALAITGVVTSAWCVFCTIVYIAHPAFSDIVNLWWFDSPFALFDLTLSGWLLFRGLQQPLAA